MVYNDALYICPGCNNLFDVKLSDKISIFHPKVQELLHVLRKESSNASGVPEVS
jgi:hypothetical protein